MMLVYRSVRTEKLRGGGPPAVNPDPRSKEKGVGSGKYTRTDKETGSLISMIKEKSLSYFKNYNNLSNETALLVDDKGNLIKDLTSNSAHEVSISDTIVNLYKDMGVVLLHNHPSGRSITVGNEDFNFTDYPFDADVGVASEMKMKAIAALGMNDFNGKRFLYAVLPPKGMPTFTPDFYRQKILPAYDKDWHDIYEETTLKVAAGEISKDEANFRHDDLVLQRLAKDTGIRYYKIPVALLPPTLKNAFVYPMKNEIAK